MWFYNGITLYFKVWLLYLGNFPRCHYIPLSRSYGILYFHQWYIRHIIKGDILPHWQMRNHTFILTFPYVQNCFFLYFMSHLYLFFCNSCHILSFYYILFGVHSLNFLECLFCFCCFLLLLLLILTQNIFSIDF